MRFMADEEFIHMVSTLALARDEVRATARQHLGALDDAQYAILSNIAASHHVVIRAFGTGFSNEVTDRFATLVASERQRVQTATSRLHEVCQALEENGCPVVVIKSLDHLPDIGTDLDLLTCSSEKPVIQTMRDCFGITIETPSWSDRVARKLNFRLPGLPELVEIHFGRLGQAGELEKLADRILQGRVKREFGGRIFWVPPPEHRIILVALQRLYRHFYLRICDIMTVANLVDTRMVDFDELRRVSKKAGVWPGVATLLRLVSDYMKHYRGQPLTLPRRVQLASRFGMEKVYPSAGFLRLPLFPQGAELYARQLVKMLRRRDTVGSARLGLIPPLALAANVRYRLTGDENGIW
jgi:Uncharacterised nucleotidyltransferase